jgi:hypothetical protein
MEPCLVGCVVEQRDPIPLRVCTGPCEWRVCFIWTDAGPTDVEIVDYH